MSEGNFIFEGDCLPPQFWSRKEFRAMPTAIIDGYTMEGFALIADGLSTDPQTKIPLRKNNQKIFLVSGSGKSLAYALYGITKITGRYDPHPALDLSDEAERAAVELADYDPSDLLTYANKFCRRLEQSLGDWKDKIDYPCSVEDIGHPGRHSILQVFFRGYYRSAPAKVDVNITHQNGSVAIELFNLPVRVGFSITGSPKVARALMRDSDPRLAEYLIPAMQKDEDDLIVDEIIEIGARYIRACDSKVGHEIDPEFAPTIGGHVHALTITANGASWRPGYEPCYFAGEGDDGARH
jgi:hypothetical protein